MSVSKRRAFNDIKQNVWQKFQARKEQLLSQGGKEVLLKVVALAIPTDTMSYFVLSTKKINELESLMVIFWLA